jgi:uncharacterized protein with PIN domain
MPEADRSVPGQVRDAPRLLCDEMLRGIGRWLRAAGYDTLIARSGSADTDLLALAAATGRILLTCDRTLAELPGHGAEVVILASEGLDAAADELRRRLGIDWLRAPFSRCLVDNAPLRPASARELAQVQESARRADETVSACPECARVYWSGSHVRRMRARLERWQQRL